MKSFKKVLLLLAVSHLLFAIAGCGYTTRSMITNKFKTIYISPFLNKVEITNEADAANKYRIYRPSLETDVTKMVINKFLWDGNLKPVKSQNADLILKGEVIEFRKDPLTYTDDEDVEEYRVNIVVNMTMWDSKENKALWEEMGFTGYTEYYTDYATGSVTKKSEATAISDAITDLARRIVERTVEQW